MFYNMELREFILFYNLLIARDWRESTIDYAPGQDH